MDTPELKRLIARIRTIVATHHGGSASPEVLRALSMIILQMKIAAGPGQVLEKLGGLERWLTIFYSPRKHRKVPGGLHQVHINIDAALSEIEAVTDSSNEPAENGQ